MSDSFFSLTLIAVCFLAGAGTYLLLVGRRSVAIWPGIVLVGLALTLLWFEFGAAADWWKQTTPNSVAASPSFIFFGLAAIVAAGMTVTARKASNSAVWFLAMLCCTAALYAIHDAQFLAVGTPLIAGGGTGTLLLLVAQRVEAVGSRSESTIAREPLLVCVCGCLLAAGLIGTFHRSLAASSVSDTQRIPAAVARRQDRTAAPAGHRPIDSSHSRSVQAGQSMFVDHPVAVVILAVLLFVAIVIGTVLTDDSAALERRIPVENRLPAVNNDQQSTAAELSTVDTPAGETPQ